MRSKRAGRVCCLSYFTHFHIIKNLIYVRWVVLVCDILVLIFGAKQTPQNNGERENVGFLVVESVSPCLWGRFGDIVQFFLRKGKDLNISLLKNFKKGEGSNTCCESPKSAIFATISALSLKLAIWRGNINNKSRYAQ